MALEGSFQKLTERLHNFSESLLALRTITLEDKPINDDAVLVELFGEAIDDMLGWTEGAWRSSAEAMQATQHPSNLNRLWRALSDCQQRFTHVQRRYASDLISHERLTELNDLAERRGGEWPAWASSVKASLDDCRDPLDKVVDSLNLCWQEMGERIGIHSIYMHTTNIGQHLASADERS